LHNLALASKPPVLYEGRGVGVDGSVVGLIGFSVLRLALAVGDVDVESLTDLVELSEIGFKILRS